MTLTQVPQYHNVLEEDTSPNRRLPGERVHLWVLTHHPSSPERWGGFDDMDDEELAEVLTQQPALLFLGGPPADVAFALERHNSTISREHVQYMWLGASSRQSG